MKKLFFVLIAFMVVFGFSGCEQPTDGKDDTSKLPILLPKLAVEQNGIDIPKNNIVNFGEATANTVKRIEFTLRNTGAGKLLFTGNEPIKISGDTDVFTVVQPSSSEIANGSSLPFTINFMPKAEQSYTAVVTVQSNNPDGDFSFTVTAKGVILKPIVSIFYEDTEILQNGTIELKEEVITTQSTTFTVVIKNTGEGNLTFVDNTDGNRIYLEDNTSGSFEIIEEPLVSAVVVPGEMSEFKIRFNPPAEDVYLATIVVSTNSQENPLFSFKVKGVCRYVIGDTGPAGGLVFYDKGTYTDGWRYMEVAPVETEFMATSGIWNYDAGVQKDIGTGAENTTIIVNYLETIGETGKAAQLCDSLVFGGYDDWFLPSLEELVSMNFLYSEGLGNFGTSDNSNYMSSSQTMTVYFKMNDYLVNFSFGSRRITTFNNDEPRFVRAIRAF